VPGPLYLKVLAMRIIASRFNEAPFASSVLELQYPTVKMKLELPVWQMRRSKRKFSVYILANAEIRNRDFDCANDARHDHSHFRKTSLQKYALTDGRICV
jgi:hypothetical protein